jgi:hypothetical protein
MSERGAINRAAATALAESSADLGGERRVLIEER